LQLNHAVRELRTGVSVSGTVRWCAP
jgi:hypothetical protein